MMRVIRRLLIVPDTNTPFVKVAGTTPVPLAVESAGTYPDRAYVYYECQPSTDVHEPLTTLEFIFLGLNQRRELPADACYLGVLTPSPAKGSGNGPTFVYWRQVSE